jgi:hypothetical protein
MKKRLIPMLAVLSTMTLLSGCVVGFSFGGGKKDSTNSTTSTTNSSDKTSNNQRPVVDQIQPTIGQQLVDLKKAKDAGAISDAEYEAEKAKLLGNGDKIGNK